MHRADYPLVAKCIVCASNYTQTIHWTIHWTLHSERPKPYTASVQNYTRSGTQTLHFVFEHESREWSEWSESYVTFVTNVTNVSNVRNVKQEMAIGGDATRHSCKPPKIQQFWAFFRRFDINIFNLSEHFPPPNFAYSAHNFSLPSSN